MSTLQSPSPNSFDKDQWIESEKSYTLQYIDYLKSSYASLIESYQALVAVLENREPVDQADS